MAGVEQNNDEFAVFAALVCKTGYLVLSWSIAGKQSAGSLHANVR
jgi:hypothetical protein